MCPKFRLLHEEQSFKNESETAYSQLLFNMRVNVVQNLVSWICLTLLLSCHIPFSPELYYDRGNHHEFVSLVKDLARPGEITQSQTFDFEFTHVEKPYESYTGQNVKLR